MIVMKYYELGDLTHHLTNNFFNIDWFNKLARLHDIVIGFENLHKQGIIHKDCHSKNIFISNTSFAVIGDLGISKSAIDDNDGEIYGVIPYVAPEIFQGKKYIKASDIYSFGM